MATSANVELKILIKVIRDSQAAIKAVVDDLKTVTGAAKESRTSSTAAGEAGGRAGQQAAAGMMTAAAAADTLKNSLKFLLGGFLALESVRFLRDLADTAARTQVLGTVLHIVGQNAGFTTAEIDKADKAVQKMGITASSSRQSLVQLMQSNLDIKWAPALARASQDLAVVAGWNSSQTFQRLIVNIQQLDTMGLRWMGIMVNRKEAEEKFAFSLGKTAEQLSHRQQQEAFMLEVLEKAKALEGAYAASMGDVGKQLTSLERYTETLKVAVGEGLLPAYLALVEEFTHLIEQLTIVARETNANKDASEALGDSIRTIAIWIRETIVWFVRHRDLIFTVIKAWIAWRAILAASYTFKWLTDLGTLLISTTTEVLKLEKAYDALTVVQGAAATSTTTFGIALAGLRLAGAIGLMVLLWEAAKQIASNVRDANKAFEEGRLGQFLSGKLDANIKSSLSWYDRMSPKSADRAALDRAEQDIFDAQEARWKANEELRKARIRQASKDEIDLAEKNLKEAKAVEAKAEEIFETRLAEATVKTKDPRLVQQERDLVAYKKILNDRKAFGEQEQQAMEDLFKNKLLFTEGKIQSEQFSKIAGGYQVLLDTITKGIQATREDLIHKGVKGDELGQQLLKNLPEIIKEQAPKLREGLKELASAAKQPADLEKLEGFVGTFKNVLRGTEDVRLASDALKRAGIAVRNAQREFRAPIIAEDKENYKNLSDAQKEALRAWLEATTASNKRRLDTIKQTNAAEESLDQDQYNRGYLAIDAYYSRKFRRLQEQGSAELELLKSQADQQEEIALKQIDVLERTPTAKPEERAALNVQIAQARNKLNEDLANAEAQRLLKSEEIKNSADENERRRINDRILLERQVQDLQEQAAQFYGGEEEAIEAINRRYDLQLLTLKGIEGAEEAINRLRQIDVLRATLDAQNKRLQDQRSLEEALLNQEEARIALSQFRGELTTIESIRLQNKVLEQRLKLIKDTIIEKQKEQQLLINRKQQEEARVALEEIAKGLSGDALEKAIRARTEGIISQIQALGVEIKDLDTQWIRLLGNIRHYGDELRQTFTDALTQLIVDSTTRFRSWADNLKSFIISIQTKVVEAVARDWAGKLTRNIVTITSKKDDKGEPIPGTSVFDKIFKALGLGTAQLGTPQNPMTVKGRVEVVESAVSAKIPFNFQLNDFFSPKQTGVFDAAFRFINQLSRSPLPSRQTVPFVSWGLPGLREGGALEGPGTGTSDDLVIRASAGEYVMPADKTKKWLPMLEAIRTGKFVKYALGGLVDGLSSVSIPTVIPRTYASGGVVVTDAGASAIEPNRVFGNMIVQLHPDALNMSMRDWLEQEVARQNSRR